MTTTKKHNIQKGHLTQDRRYELIVSLKICGWKIGKYVSDESLVTAWEQELKYGGSNGSIS